MSTIFGKWSYTLFFRQIHMKGSITVLRHNQPREPAQAALSNRLLLDLLVGHRSMKIAMFLRGDEPCSDTPIQIILLVIYIIDKWYIYIYYWYVDHIVGYIHYWTIIYTMFIYIYINPIIPHYCWWNHRFLTGQILPRGFHSIHSQTQPSCSASSNSWTAAASGSGQTNIILSLHWNQLQSMINLPDFSLNGIKVIICIMNIVKMNVCIHYTVLQFSHVF